MNSTQTQAIDLLSFYRAAKKVTFDEDNIEQTNFQSDTTENKKNHLTMADENNKYPTSSASSQQSFPSNKTNGIRTAENEDILSGRGAGINAHPGNAFFRKLIQSNQQRYANADPAEKKRIIKEIHKIALSHGRFLKHDLENDAYIELTFEESRKKTAQALRENAPSIKKQLQVEETTAKNNKRKIDDANIAASPSPSPISRISALEQMILNLTGSPSSTSRISTLEQTILNLTQGSNVRAPTNNESTMYMSLLLKCHLNVLKEKQARLKKEQRELEEEQMQLMQYLYQMTVARKTNASPLSNRARHESASETNIRQNGGPYKKRRRIVEL